MILKDFKFFPNFGRLIGIDWGARRVGIAISDLDQGFVFVREKLEYKKENNAVPDILKIIESENIKGVVIGLPTYSDGSESKTTKNVREFGKNLELKTDLPIIFIDESLTSFAASEFAEKNNLDSQAARLILENAISLMRRKKE